MNFILFNVTLLIAGFAAVLIFSVGLMACFAPIAIFAKSENPPKVLIFPLMGIAAIYQIYFWGFWSAYCVAMTLRFTQKPEVTWDWVYWITGFLECTSLIGWLANKERQSSGSLAEARKIGKGATLYSLIAIVAFLVFAFIPNLISVPYGWALKPLGMGTFITAKTGQIQIDEGERKSVEGFFEGYKHTVAANKLALTFASSKDPVGDFERVRSLFNESKEKLSHCDNRVLNDIYAGWGDVVGDKFIPAIDLLLAGVEQKGDRLNIARGDALMSEFNFWLQNNWGNIMRRLKDKGYPIE